MASSDLKFKRTITDRISIKGVLSDDGMSITYYDENNDEQDVEIVDLLNAFKDQPIDLNVSLKTEEDLDIIPYEENIEE